MLPLPSVLWTHPFPKTDSLVVHKLCGLSMPQKAEENLEVGYSGLLSFRQVLCPRAEGTMLAFLAWFCHIHLSLLPLGHSKLCRCLQPT